MVVYSIILVIGVAAIEHKTYLQSPDNIAHTIEIKRQVHHDKQKSQENSLEIIMGALIMTCSLIPVVPMNSMEKHE